MGCLPRGAFGSGRRAGTPDRRPAAGRVGRGAAGLRPEGRASNPRGLRQSPERARRKTPRADRRVGGSHPPEPTPDPKGGRPPPTSLPASRNNDGGGAENEPP